MRDIECTDPPTQTGLDVVSLAEAKRHIRLESADFDEELTAAINDAVAYLDGKGGILNRTIMPREWTLYLAAFPKCGKIELPFAPLLEVTSISYLGSDGVTAALDGSKFIVRAESEPAEIEIIDTWPSTKAHPRAVIIVFTAGYELYPDNLKRAVKFLAAHYFANREATVAGRANETYKLEFGLEHLLAGLTVPHAYGEDLQ